MNRALKRLSTFYKGLVQDGQDSFQGPQDFVRSFFHISYELKESIKKANNMPSTLSSDVEKFARCNQWVALSLDIANQEKHVTLDRSRTGKKIGVITTNVHVLDPNGRDRTELKIEINGKKEDCLELAKETIDVWKAFLIEKKLI